MSEFAVQVALHWVGVALYMAAAFLMGAAVFFGKDRAGRWAVALAAAGLVPHGAAILLRWSAVGHGPYMLKFEVLSSNAWIGVLFLVVFLARRPAWRALGLVVLPIAILSIAVGIFSAPGAKELPPTLRSIWLVFHVTFAKLSAGAFLLSLASGVLILMEGRPRPPGTWRDRVPALPALDAYTVRFAGYGFVFWTVTIAAGAIWADQSWGRYWGWDPIETWSLVAWLTYGTMLHARLFLKLKPTPTAWASVASFAIFILALLILPFLIPSLHASYFQ